MVQIDAPARVGDLAWPARQKAALGGQQTWARCARGGRASRV
jgi:hypothetical protein